MSSLSGSKRFSSSNEGPLRGSSIERGFASMARNKADAVIIMADGMFREHRRQIGELALKHRLPSSFANSEYSDAGGLLVYAANVIENFPRAAGFVDKIMKGAKPNDLPVEQPTKFELVINGKPAKSLGLSIPKDLLVLAEVI